MDDYKKLITDCVDEYMNSDAFADIVRKNVAKCMEDAIAESFRWGELKKAMKAKVDEVMVPYIERYDMEAYTAKLDLLLTQVAEQTAVADNKRILENFGVLMKEDDGKSITLAEVFLQYQKFVAKEASGQGLDVEDGCYCPVGVCCSVVSQETRGFSYRWEEVVVELTADVPDDDERLSLSVALDLHGSRYGDGEYRLYNPRVDPGIDSLVRMNDFEVFLARLNRAHVTVTDIRSMEDWVDIEAQPEYELV